MLSLLDIGSVFIGMPAYFRLEYAGISILRNRFTYICLNIYNQ